MANSQGMATTFKRDILLGKHALGTTVVRGATTKDSFKAALFLASATITAATSSYSSTGELAASGNYSAGGVAITNGTDPATSSTSAIWTPTASFVWTALTSSGAFDCCQVYNSTQSNLTVSVHTFGSQSITAADFTLTMPVNAVGTALVQIT